MTVTKTSTTKSTATAHEGQNNNSAPSGYVKAGVAIGVRVALGIALMIALAVIAWLLRKPRTTMSPTASAPYHGTERNEVESNTRSYEVPFNPRFEEQGDDVPELS